MEDKKIEKKDQVKINNDKLLLEAEMGRLFLRIEQLKAEQENAALRINQILQTLKGLTNADKKD